MKMDERIHALSLRMTLLLPANSKYDMQTSRNLEILMLKDTANLT